ncbi:hypothetical protein ACN47E_007516 [Coniothyrium glycines]
MAERKPRQRKFAPRSRTGCLTCRQRRKRCDNRQPRCENCTRLNLTCDWQAPRRVVATIVSRPTSPRTQLSVPQSLHPPGGLWDSPLIDSIAEKQQLLHYYIEAFVPSVSVAAIPTSFYTSLYVPWAFQIDGMLNAILAIASAQLARRTESQERAEYLRMVSCRHEGMCYAFIKDRICLDGSLPRDPYQVAAVILILVGLEALNGAKTTRWISQLKSVQRILNLLPPEQRVIDCIEIDSLQRHFTYHSASASLMANVSNVSMEFSTERELVLLTAAAPVTIDPLMGINYQLCDLISRIQYLSSGPAFPLVTEASFHAIELDIQKWNYQNPFSFGVDLSTALDLVALAEAYRIAALIQLYRSSPMHTVLIPACASRSMEFISRIPPGSPAESSLLYPIFLAGAELDDDVAIDRCTRRLEDIQNRNRYENVSSAQKVLQEVWRSRSKGSKRDWEDILREWQWSFTLG